MGGSRWSRVLLQGEGLTVRSKGRFTVGFFVDVVMPGFRDLRIADDVPQL